MRVVLYARYSSDNQTENSIEGQIRECKSFCERSGMTVIKTYIDRAFSAKSDRRPDFQNLIRDSEKRLFDAVVVWKLDRFSRNRYDSAYYKLVRRRQRNEATGWLTATQKMAELGVGYNKLRSMRKNNEVIWQLCNSNGFAYLYKPYDPIL